MKLALLPPADLLDRVERIDQGLQRRRALGLIGTIVAFQILALILRTLVLDLGGLISTWPLGLYVVLLAMSLFLVALRRVWILESRQLFRSTYSIDLKPIEGTEIELSTTAAAGTEPVNSFAANLTLSHTGVISQAG